MTQARRTQANGTVADKTKTLRLVVDPEALDSEASEAALRRAAEILRRGGTVAFATETVYGLGANALDAAAVVRIFEAKRRPAWDPLIVHLAHREQLQRIVAGMPEKARSLMDAFWPGPLTLLLPKLATVPAVVTAGRPRIGVRMPSHPVARRLLELAQLPIAAPSANSFGRTSPTRAKFVLEDLDGRIDAVIDSGETLLGLESTVVDICEDPPILYRPGMVSLADLRSICGPVVEYRAAAGPALLSQPAPGTGLRHYAPRARLVLLEPSGRASADSQLIRDLEAQGEAVGMMLPDGYYAAGESPRPSLVYRWGEWGNVEELARRLFAGLRELDRAGATVILCPVPEGNGIGAAVRDRLLKAAQPVESMEKF